MSHQHIEGPPCRHMEDLIQSLADGSAHGVRRWYAASHASRCYRCGNFLQRLRVTIELLRASRNASDNPAAIERLRAQVEKIESGASR